MSASQEMMFPAETRRSSEGPGTGEHSGGQASAVSPTRAATMEPGKDGEYVCPLHRQVRQAGPGHCPSYRMMLEPVADAAVADSRPNMNKPSPGAPAHRPVAAAANAAGA